MINHARTLLLNRSGSNRPPTSYFLEEYVPASFGKLQLPAYLGTIHETLVGAEADDAWANFRMRQYTTVLHSTEFASYVLELDDRVTYLRDRSVLNDVETVEISSLNSYATRAYKTGELVPSSNQPRLLYEWEVEMTSPLTARSTDSRTNRSVSRAISVNDGLSSPVVMAGQASFGIMIVNPASGAAWKVAAFAPPPGDLQEVVSRLASLGGNTLGSLFAGSEPYSVFKELWEKHCFLSYRLSGLLLAFVHRMEGIRIGSAA